MNSVVMRFEAPLLAYEKGAGILDFMGVLACCSGDTTGTIVCCNV